MYEKPGGQNKNERYSPENGRYIGKGSGSASGENPSEDERSASEIFGVSNPKIDKSAFDEPTPEEEMNMGYDSIDIKEEEQRIQENSKNPPVCKIYDQVQGKSIFKDNRTPERKQMDDNLVNETIAEQRATRDIKRDNKATIVIGFPASGKTSVSRKIANESGCFILDSDDFKSKLPEMRADSSNVSKIHDESALMNDQMLHACVSDGSNIVIPTTGSNTKAIEEQIKSLQSMSYDVSVIYCQVPMKTAMRRNIVRYRDLKQIADPNNPARLISAILFHRYAKGIEKTVQLLDNGIEGVNFEVRDTSGGIK